MSRLTVLIVKRLVRVAWWRRLLVSSAAVVAVLTVSVLSITALARSQEQQEASSMGRFEALMPIDQGDEPSLTLPLQVGQSTRLTESRSLQPDGWDGPRVRYAETAWNGNPYPHLNLTSGRWPRHAGEVAVSPGSGLPQRGSIPVLSGGLVLRVVGVVTDDLDRAPVLYGAPGTLAGIPQDVLAHHSRLDVTMSYLGPIRDVRTVQAVARSHGASVLQLVTRDDVKAEQSWVEGAPLAFWVPALAVPALVVGCVMLAYRSVVRRFVRHATAVGARRTTLLRALSTATALSWVLGACIGLVIGGLVGVGVRWGISHWGPAAAGQWPSIITVAAPVVTGLVLAALSPALVLRRDADVRATVHEADAPGPRSRGLRFVGSAAALAGGLWMGFHRVSVDDAMYMAALFMLAIFLVLPEAVAAVGRRLARHPGVARLAGRLVVGRRGAQTTGVALAIFLTAAPAVTLCLMTATNSTARSNAVSELAEGQLALVGSSLGADNPRPGVVATAQRAVPSLSTDQVYSLPHATYMGGSGSFAVMAVDSPEAVERVFARPLTERQRQTLTSGGLLAWRDEGSFGIDGRQPPPVPVASYRPAEEWRLHSAAVMLTSTARTLRLTQTKGGLIASGLTRDEIERVRTANRDAGWDEAFVVTHRPAKTLLPPVGLICSFVGLCLLMIAGLCFAGSARVASLRRQMGRLTAIGMSPRQVRRLVVTCDAASAVAAVALAAVLTSVVVAIVAAQSTSVQFNIPWAVLLGLVLAVLLATIATALVNVQRLKPETARGG